MENSQLERLARDIMTNDVRTVEPGTTIQDAANEMREVGVGSLPVCDSGKLVGIITDRDIAVRSVALGQDPRSAVVADVMSQDVTWCREDAALSEVVHLMQSMQLRRLPVVDEAERVVGMIALADVAHAEIPDDIKAESLEGVS